MNTVNILGVILLVTMVVFARPIWHWIKAGDKPRLLDQRITDPWVRTYRAKHQSEAILAARADIMATCPGFHISTMNWENRGPGIGRVVAIGIFAWAARPKGELTITLAADAPIGPVPATPSPQAPATTMKRGTSTRPLVGALAVVVVVLLAVLSMSRGPTKVTYQVTGTARSINITYTDGSGNIQQQNSLSVPLTARSGSAGITFTSNRGQFASIFAQNQDATGTLDCAIEADGEVLNTGHASGGYAIASCSTTLP